MIKHKHKFKPAIVVKTGKKILVCDICDKVMDPQDKETERRFKKTK